MPGRAGLSIDWEATLDRAAATALNPWTRLTSFWSIRDVGVATRVDESQLTGVVEALRPAVDRAPIEGDIVFEGGDPVAVWPVSGRTLVVGAAKQILRDSWAESEVLTLPVDTTATVVSEEGVRRALAEVAVLADVRVTGRNRVVATIGSERIGQVLSFTPDDRGGLVRQVDIEAAIGILGPQLAPTEVRPRGATVRLSGGRPEVVPASEGEVVDWIRTLESLPAASAVPRSINAIYVLATADFTTEQAESLGIEEVIGEFTTAGFSAASGENIRRIAKEINGAVIKPGDTFSLNNFTGPRGEDQGYVESGIINNGRPDRAVGGGISQFATTLYNATYFAGIDDVEHTEHSYYISRYPPAREATVFEGAIDLKFRNPADTGILIETISTGSNITVRVWGTHTVDVVSITGDRHDYTPPQQLTLSGDSCAPSTGSQGFTTSDTRVIADHATGREISRTTRTVTYDPSPIVTCA